MTLVSHETVESVAPGEVTVRDLSMEFTGRGGRTSVFAGIDLSISSGSFTAVVGPSGCGKSTLLQLLGGFLKPTKGEVRIDDHPVDGPPSEAVVVFQNYAKSVFPWMTVLQNVVFGLQARRSMGSQTRRELEERARDRIRQVGLEAVTTSYPYQLSGGMQQRVAIARALACEPEVLFMDEPFSAVDALTRSELQDAVLSLWADVRPTIVFVTHDIDEAVYLSQEVIVLAKSPGRVERVAPIPLPYPRDQVATRESSEFLRCRREILADIMSR